VHLLLAAADADGAPGHGPAAARSAAHVLAARQLHLDHLLELVVLALARVQFSPHVLRFRRHAALGKLQLALVDLLPGGGQLAAQAVELLGEVSLEGLHLELLLFQADVLLCEFVLQLGVFVAEIGRRSVGVGQTLKIWKLNAEFQG
jgi:hypothetical protein